MGDILLIGVWTSVKTLRLVFGILRLGVSISEETLLLINVISILRVWRSDKMLPLLLDILLPGVWIRDETLLFLIAVLLLVVLRYQMNHSFSCLTYYFLLFVSQMEHFVSSLTYCSPVLDQVKNCFSCFISYFSCDVNNTSQCLERWNTPSRVWYITSWSLDIRWNTPSLVLSVFRCQMKHSFSCLIYYSDFTSQCLEIRWNTPSCVWCITSQCLDSLRSRRLEVVSERENGRARGRHAKGEGAPARKAPENRFNSHSVSADISNSALY